MKTETANLLKKYAERSNQVGWSHREITPEKKRLAKFLSEFCGIPSCQTWEMHPINLVCLVCHTRSPLGLRYLEEYMGSVEPNFYGFESEDSLDGNSLLGYTPTRYASASNSALWATALLVEDEEAGALSDEPFDPYRALSVWGAKNKDLI